MLSDTLLGVLGTPESIRVEAKDYLQITFLGILFLFGYNFISTVLRALGDSKTPMRFVGVAVVLNVVLDPFFIRVDPDSPGRSFNQRRYEREPVGQLRHRQVGLQQAVEGVATVGSVPRRAQSCSQLRERQRFITKRLDNRLTELLALFLHGTDDGALRVSAEHAPSAD